jgi:hypothetical protein
MQYVLNASTATWTCIGCDPRVTGIAKDGRCMHCGGMRGQRPAPSKPERQPLFGTRLRWAFRTFRAAFRAKRADRP